jgi:hypothetical protein
MNPTVALDVNNQKAIKIIDSSRVKLKTNSQTNVSNVQQTANKQSIKILPYQINWNLVKGGAQMVTAAKQTA